MDRTEGDELLDKLDEMDGGYKTTGLEVECPTCRYQWEDSLPLASDFFLRRKDSSRSSNEVSGSTT